MGLEGKEKERGRFGGERERERRGQKRRRRRRSGGDGLWREGGEGRVSVCVPWSCRIIEVREESGFFFNSAASVQLFIESNYSVSMWHSSLRLTLLFILSIFCEFSGLDVNFHLWTELERKLV